MSERPELSASLDAETFRGNYLKEKLVAFCRRNHLPVSGGKTELIERVADFLDTGTVSRPRTKRKAPAAERSPGRRSSSRTRCAPKRTGRFLRRKSGGAFLK
ncbi:MAG: SAP domain-containing protein [Eubacteriales bacterium]|nr:SAP domain-containing protein [Eubacteriales bacterium]